MNSHASASKLADFLADQCDATKERYAQTLASMGDDFGPSEHFDYAESLVYFGLAERKVFPSCAARTSQAAGRGLGKLRKLYPR